MSAFVLTSLAASISVGVTVGASVGIERARAQKDKPLNTGVYLLVCVLIAFVSTFVSCIVLFVVFGYGGSQLSLPYSTIEGACNSLTHKSVRSVNAMPWVSS